MSRETCTRSGMRTLGFIAAVLVVLSLLSGAVMPSLASIPEANGSRYTVRWGDTLAKIARRYYGDGKAYQVIAEANKLKNPHRILSGAVLLIPIQPSASSEQQTATVQSSTTTVTPSPETAAASTDSVTVTGAIAETLPVFSWRKEENTGFGTKEKLEFDVRWKFISVGSATMEIHRVEDVNGRQAYHIYTSARSSNFFDTFYKVRDTNESWMDVESLCSLKFASRINEGGHARNETVCLDHEKKQFRIEESGQTGEISPWTQDVLSALYYLRTRELEVGKEYILDAHSSDKSWPLLVRVVGREKVKVPAGEFDCYVVEPAIREGAGIFQAKGSLQVWMTADGKRVPVLMRSKIAVGAIEAQLKSMQLQ